MQDVEKSFSNRLRYIDCAFLYHNKKLDTRFETRKLLVRFSTLWDCFASYYISHQNIREVTISKAEQK